MKKILLTLLVLVLVGGTTAWFKRNDILLAVIKYKTATEYDVAGNREIPWQQGPAEPVANNGEQPPNIILIVADDLGYNDISTFGGGVAGGLIKTPGIDRLAAEGAVFRQSYSGASTCARWAGGGGRATASHCSGSPAERAASRPAWLSPWWACPISPWRPTRSPCR